MNEQADKWHRLTGSESTQHNMRKLILDVASAVIPWRVKNQFSNYFPMIYHLIANLGSGNQPEYWDRRLEATWDDEVRSWPKKNKIIASLTRRDDRILDIACGNGSILRHLAKKGYTDLHGLEVSQYAIKRLNAEGIEMHYGVLPNIELENDFCDVVIASQILEHLIKRKRFLAELSRVLRPGGRAFIFVPDNCLGPIDENEHTIKFNRDSLERLLSKYLYIESIESIQDANHRIPILFAKVSKPNRC